jgi:hypothetical protein
LFTLTDADDLLAAPTRRAGSVEVVALPWAAPPWPYPTLWRYHAMLAYADLLQTHVTHLVYCDVDMRFVGDTAALFQDALVAVTHPAAWRKPTELWEERPESAAYVEPHMRGVYVAGGVQGGPVGAYLWAAATCARSILQDHLAGRTAVWHDESHWNRFMQGRADVLTLGAEYCWPESWPVPAGLPSPRVLALDKDHHALRGTRSTLQRGMRTAAKRIPGASELARRLQRNR